MAVTDHNDIFIGSTQDGWTFAVLNRPIRNAARILTDAGFTPRAHQGRTVYLLPPESAEDAHERAGVAIYGLITHTLDLVDLAWTTRAAASSTPAVTIRFNGTTVSAAAGTGDATTVLTQHGFTPTGRRQFVLPPGLSERQALSAVVRTEAHLYTEGIGVRVDLGIPTVRDIPPPPVRKGSSPSPHPATRAQRRTR
jgi:hypothetical protein